MCHDEKTGTDYTTISAICLAHGLQLVIQVVFYTQSRDTEELLYHSRTSEADEEDDFEIMDDDDEIDGLFVLGDAALENTNYLRYDILALVNKIRKIVKIFKRSPLKNETTLCKGIISKNF